jgi:serine-type D-Ala-D-Ala carboxypeptidase
MMRWMNKSAELGERIAAVLDPYLTEQVERGSFPSAVYAVGTSRDFIIEKAFGNAVVDPVRIEARVDTIYDAASITKPLVTVPIALLAVAEGRIKLDDAIGRWLPELGPDKRDLTFADLLTHRSGFEAWHPLYAEGLGQESYLRSLIARPLQYEPRTQVIYSDLGFMLLYNALERVFDESMHVLAKERVLAKLSLRAAMFNPPAGLRNDVAATEWGNAAEREMVAARSMEFDQFRDYMIWGEVNDGHSYYMGGFAGTAGLFATARDVYELARVYVSDVLLPRDVIELALQNHTAGLDDARAIGWQLHTLRSNNPSSVLSTRSFGHTGFTGTSVWVDPERDLILVLLTNRLHAAGRPPNIQEVRKRFHQLVADEYDRMDGVD